MVTDELAEYLATGYIVVIALAGKGTTPVRNILIPSRNSR